MLTPAQMQLDKVLKVEKYRGETEGFVGRVVDVRDVHVRPPHPTAYKQTVVTRSQYLVTLERVGETPEGEPTAKSFYHAFADAHIVAG